MKLSLTLALLFAATGTAFAGPPRYTVTDLGTLGGKGSSATWLNSRGDVVGQSQTRYGKQHAFLWHRGKMQDLGVLPGGALSKAIGINQSDQVVGYSDGLMSEGLYKGSIVRQAFLWNRGHMQRLAKADGGESSACSINDRGQVVGEAEFPVAGTQNIDYQAFLWKAGKMTFPPTGVNYGTWAKAINNRGQILLTLSDLHLALWQNSMLRVLPLTVYSPDQDAPIAFNNRTQFYAEKLDKNGFGAGTLYLWQDGIIKSKLAVPEASYYANGKVSSLNDYGDAVGFYIVQHGPGEDRLGIPLVWTKGKPYVAQHLIRPRSGWEIQEVTAINNRGQIVGTGVHHGHRHAFLLTPITK